jgi:hypothetical protein
MSDWSSAIIGALTGAAAGSAVSYLAARSIALKAEYGRRQAESGAAIKRLLREYRADLIARYSQAAGMSGVIAGGIYPIPSAERLPVEVVGLLDPYPSFWAEAVLEALVPLCGRRNVAMAVDLPDMMDPQERKAVRSSWVALHPEMRGVALGSLNLLTSTGNLESLSEVVADIDAAIEKVGIPAFKLWWQKRLRNQRQQALWARSLVRRRPRA